MIGALILRQAFAGTMKANIESRDPKRLAAAMSEDVVVTFPGDKTVVGKAAAEQYFAAIFESIAEEHVTVKKVALVHPYAFGLKNTVLCEVDVRAVLKDGSELSGTEVYAVDVNGKLTTGLRFYVGDTSLLQHHRTAAGTL